MKIFIAIPCLDFLPGEAVFPLMALMARQAYDPKLRKSVDILAIQPCHNTIIPDARRYLVEIARESAASHIWFIDSDVVVNTDTLNQLISHHKDIVGGSYVKRYEPHEMLGNRDMSQSPSGRLLPMATMPLGCCLIKLSVFDRISRPWFAYEFGPNPGRTRDISEDSWFCRQARGAGLDIWQDPSLGLGHIGTKVFR